MNIDDAIKKLSNFDVIRQKKIQDKTNQKYNTFRKLETDITNLLPKISKLKTLCELFAKNHIRNEQLFFRSEKSHHLGFGKDKIVPLKDEYVNNRCWTPNEFFGYCSLKNSQIHLLTICLNDKALYYNGHKVSSKEIYNIENLDNCIELMKLFMKEFFYYEEQILLVVEKFR